MTKPSIPPESGEWDGKVNILAYDIPGDIILFPEQAKQIYENALKTGQRRVKRKFIGSNLRRWDPTRPIIYSFDGSHTSREQRIIELALEHWHNITCLNFVRNDNANSGNRIVFTDVDGCASNVGRHPLGEEQLVSLAPECIRLGVIAHEVAHALGFWHEQSRPDRDQFVNVRWENIDKDSKGQFLKEDPDDVDNAGVPYDYGSIMHYRSKAFSRYDDLYTISTFVTDYQKTIGKSGSISVLIERMQLCLHYERIAMLLDNDQVFMMVQGAAWTLFDCFPFKYRLGALSSRSVRNWIIEAFINLMLSTLTD
ncbi:unnamed protein product, partial [Nippostrongylus brasiliensis]